MKSMLKRGGGGGGGSISDAPDDDDGNRDTTNLGDLANDVQANQSGHDQKVEESASGADTNDIAVKSLPGRTSIVDPDTSNDDTTDQVGIDVSPESVSVTTVNDDGEGTSTTTTGRADPSSSASTTDVSDRDNPNNEKASDGENPISEILEGAGGKLALAVVAVLVVAGIAGAE